MALDSYRRPIFVLVPPQLLAAAFVYTSSLYTNRLNLFKSAGIGVVDRARESLTAKSDSQVLGLHLSPQVATSPSQSKQIASVLSVTGKEFLEREFRETSLLANQNWLTLFPRCSLNLEDVHRLAAILLEDLFEGE